MKHFSVSKGEEALVLPKLQEISTFSVSIVLLGSLFICFFFWLDRSKWTDQEPQRLIWSLFMWLYLPLHWCCWSECRPQVCLTGSCCRGVQLRWVWTVLSSVSWGPGRIWNAGWLWNHIAWRSTGRNETINACCQFFMSLAAVTVTWDVQRFCRFPQEFQDLQDRRYVHVSAACLPDRSQMTSLCCWAWLYFSSNTFSSHFLHKLCPCFWALTLAVG